MSVRAFEKFVADNDTAKTKKKKNNSEKRTDRTDTYLTEVKIALEKEYGRKTVINKGKNGEIIMQVTFSDMDDFKNEISKIKG